MSRSKSDTKIALNAEGSTRLVAVSNRLPISLERSAEGWTVHPGGGGLVRAIAPVLQDRGGGWIGWSGLTENIDINQVLSENDHHVGYDYFNVALTKEDVEGFYLGFSNNIIWPLFHDLQTRCDFDPRSWEIYKRVNNFFAEAVGRHSQETDYIWIHDYHLIHLAEMLRLKKLKRKTGFFLHIPFPALDIFMKLPWRDRMLQAMTEFDMIGFQTLRDRRNFLNCLYTLMPDVKSSGGRSAVLDVTIREKQFRVGCFPISIDFDAFSRIASKQLTTLKVGWIRKAMMGSRIILGADRLDYTKGIPERLMSFRNALERFPELREKLTLVQVVVPSRESLMEYRALKSEIERLVGEINGRFTHAGWVPIHYLYRNLGLDELIAYYRAADIALVTPLKDGMNLIAKEYCASNINEDGALILSEFAGAAAQLHQGALLVNPYDIEGVADAIQRAYHMTENERGSRMRRLRDSVRRNDIFRWVDSYLEAAFSINLDNLPAVEEFIPQISLDIDSTKE